MLHHRDSRHRGLDDLPAAVEPPAVVDGEHGHGAAASRLGKALVEQFHRALALAAGRDEVVDERTTGGARQPDDDGGGDRPGPDGGPWPAGAGVADATDEAIHDGPPWVVRMPVRRRRRGVSLRSGAGTVARSGTGWPS